MADITLQKNENNNNDVVTFLASNLLKASKSDNAVFSKEESKFSNFLNNMDAKAQNVKADYQPSALNSAIKSNTSSINKKALNPSVESQYSVSDTKKISNPKEVLKSNKAQYSNKTSNKSLNKKGAIDSSIQSNSPKQNVVKNDTGAENSAVLKTDNKIASAESVDKNKHSSTLNTDEIKTDETVKINSNNSPVEPSPVISLDENETKDEINETDSALLALGSAAYVPSTAFQVQENTKDIKNDKLISDEKIDSIDSKDGLIKVTENFFEFLGNNETLSDDEKQEINKALNEILSEISSFDGEVQESANISFENIKDKLKNVINDINSINDLINGEAVKEASVVLKSDTINQNDNQNLLSDKSDNESIKSINTASLNDSSKIISDDETLNAAFNVDSSIDNTLQNESNGEKNIEKIRQFENDFNKIKSLLSKFKLSNSIDVSLNDIFSNDQIEELENIETSLIKLADSILNQNESLQSFVETSKAQFEALKDEISSTLQTVSDIINLNQINDRLSKIDSNDFRDMDKDSLKEIMDLFKVAKDTFDLSDLNDLSGVSNIKKEIENFLETADLDNLKTDENILNTVKTVVSELTDTVSKTIFYERNLLTDRLNSKSDGIVQDINLDDLKPDESLTFLNSQMTSDEKTKIADNSEPVLKGDKIKAAVENKINNKINDSNEKSSKNDTETIKAKTDSIITNKEDETDIISGINKNQFDELVEELEIKTGFSMFNEAPALSVTDEVAKIALNESNVISPVESGQVVYDSKVIKVSDFTRNVSQKADFELEKSDILSKVSNKIENLANNQGQKLTLVLRPHDLGRLSIEMVSKDGSLSANIVAQNDSVRSYIDKNIDGLKNQLLASGVNVNNIQIKTAGSQNSSFYQGNEGESGKNGFESFENNGGQKDNLSKDGQNQEHNKKDAQEMLDKITNLDFKFERDFSAVLNKSINYGQ